MFALELTAALLALAAVLYLPGSLLLWATGRRGMLSFWLLPAAELAASLALLAPGLAATLALGLPVAWVVAWLVLCCVVLAVVGARRASRTRAPARLPAARRERVAAIGVLSIALLGGALALYAGGDLRRDQEHHTARATKLAQLDEPTFGGTSRFADGSASAPYALPLWQEVQALAATTSRQDVSLVAWLLPTLVVPVAILAMAGLAAMLWRTHVAAFVATVSWLAVLVVGHAPDLRHLTAAHWPGSVVVLVLVPLLLGLVVAAIDDGLGFAPLAPRDRRATLLAAAVVVGLVGVLHANYIAYAAMLVAGVLAFALVAGAWTRRAMAAHARVAVTLLVAAALSVAALWPVVSDHEQLGRDYDDRVAEVAVDGGSAARLDDYFEQVPGGGRVVATHPLLPQPVLVGAALLALLALLRPRDRATWVVVGGLAAVVTVARSPWLLGPLLDLGNVTVATRIGLALLVPLVLAATFAVLDVPRRLATLRDEGWAGRLQAAAAVVLVAVAALLAVDAGDVASDARGVVLLALPWATLVVLVATLGWRLSHLTDSVPVPLPAGSDAAATPAPRRLLVATSIVGSLLVATAMVAANEVLAPRYERARLREPVVAQLERHVGGALRELEPGAVVMTDVQTAYHLPTLAPVYVVGDFKWWLEATRDNAPAERYEAATAWAEASPGAIDERIRLLERWDATHVLLTPASERARRLVEERPGCFRSLARGGEYELVEVLTDQHERCERARG